MALMVFQILRCVGSFRFRPGKAAPAVARLGLLALLLTAGCRDRGAEEPGEPSEPGDVEPLRIVVLDDPALAEGIEKEWKVRSEVPIDLRSLSWSDLEPEARIPGDLVIYPSGLLGQLVQSQAIVPLEPAFLNDPQFALHDILELLRLREISWDRRAWGVPLGSPQLMLMYRQDIFEELQLQPPQTWDDYARVVETLAENLPEQSQSGGLEAAVAQPLGPHWAAVNLIARAAGYLSEDDQSSFFFDWSSLEPQLTNPVFERALSDLVRDARVDGVRNVPTPHEARQALLEGKVAMAWSWPTGARAEKTESPGPIALARLPGAAQTYHRRGMQWEVKESEEPHRIPLLAVAGRMASVTRNARQTEVAENVLVWLSGKELGSQFAPRSPETAPFRMSQLGRMGPWMNPALRESAGSDYSKLMREMFTRSRAVVLLRIPGRGEYLAALSEGVRSAVADEQSVTEALQEAASQWEAITERLGRELQRASYEQSIEL